MKEFKRKNTQATTDQFFNENNTKERIKAKKINEFNRNDKKSYNIHQEDLIMCIQCEGKIKSEANKINAYFTLLDEMFLTVYSECVANAVSRIVAFREIQHKNVRINEIFEFCKSVVVEHDHSGLQEKIESNIANILDHDLATLIHCLQK